MSNLQSLEGAFEEFWGLKQLYLYIHVCINRGKEMKRLIGLGKIGLLIHILSFLFTNKVGSKSRTSLIAPSNAHIGDFSAFTHLTAWGPLEVNLGFPVSC